MTELERQTAVNPYIAQIRELEKYKEMCHDQAQAHGEAVGKLVRDLTYACQKIQYLAAYGPRYENYSEIAWAEETLKALGG